MSAHTQTTQQYVDEGLRVLLAEDWFIYVVREADNLVFVYNTELWYEWLDVPEGATVAAMIPFAHDHTPSPLAKVDRNYCTARSVGGQDQETLESWLEHAA